MELEKESPGWLPRRLRYVVVALLVLGVGGFLVDGVSRAPRPRLVPPANAATQVGQHAQAGQPAQAVTLLLRGAPVSAGGGSAIRASGGAAPVRLCFLEASTPAQQARGLMGVRRIAPYAGMVFVFPSPSEARFYMRGMLIPVSLAWFDAKGRYIGSVTMPLCPTGIGCALFAAPAPFTLAVEAPAGGLGRLGIGPGSTVSLGGSCTA